MARIAVNELNPVLAGKVVTFEIFKTLIAHVVVDVWYSNLSGLKL
jgi:hypothetical protein